MIFWISISFFSPYLCDRSLTSGSYFSLLSRLSSISGSLLSYSVTRSSVFLYSYSMLWSSSRSLISSALQESSFSWKSKVCKSRERRFINPGRRDLLYVIKSFSIRVGGRVYSSLLLSISLNSISPSYVVTFNSDSSSTLSSPSCWKES